MSYKASKYYNYKVYTRLAISFWTHCTADTAELLKESTEFHTRVKFTQLKLFFWSHYVVLVAPKIWLSADILPAAEPRPAVSISNAFCLNNDHSQHHAASLLMALDLYQQACWVDSLAHHHWVFERNSCEISKMRHDTDILQRDSSESCEYCPELSVN